MAIKEIIHITEKFPQTSLVTNFLQAENFHPLPIPDEEKSKNLENTKHKNSLIIDKYFLIHYEAILIIMNLDLKQNYCMHKISELL